MPSNICVAMLGAQGLSCRYSGAQPAPSARTLPRPLPRHPPPLGRAQKPEASAATSRLWQALRKRDGPRERDGDVQLPQGQRLRAKSSVEQHSPCCLGTPGREGLQLVMQEELPLSVPAAFSREHQTWLLTLECFPPLPQHRQLLTAPAVPSSMRNQKTLSQSYQSIIPELLELKLSRDAVFSHLKQLNCTTLQNCANH